MEKDSYYFRKEVSNSDLSWADRYWRPAQYVVDLEKAFAFGTLLDCMITEPHKVDFFKLTCAGTQYFKEDFDKAKAMKKAFYADSFCSQFVKQCSLQKVTIKRDFTITLDNGFTFKMDARCRWDLYCENIDMGGDIKTTAATTQKQFEDSIYQFDYDRSRAWYMDLADRNNDMIIGISKVNFKVFKVPIKRGDKWYNSGLEKYKELAFRYWYLFGEI